MNATSPRRNAWQSLELRGRVTSRRGEIPLGLILAGTASDRPGEEVQFAFSAAAPNDIATELDDVRIDRLDERHHRIVGGARQWTVQGIAHVHRDVGKSFYEAVPPRIVPWHKRAFWRLALGVAASKIGRRVLFRSR